MKIRWYSKNKEELFFYKIGCNAKRSFVLRQGKNGRYEWHDSLTEEILGWLCCGIYYVGCQLIKLNKTMDEIKKAVKRDE